MRVGVALPVNGPLASPAGIRRVAEACERLDVDTVWCSDHVSWGLEDAAERHPAVVADGGVVTADHFEPLATLAHLSGVTQRVRLGTAILVLPVRNPVLLAKQVATLDALSGGRVVLGVGVGGTAHADADFGAVGLGDVRGSRGQMTDEWLQVMRRVWTEPTVTHAGRHIDVRGASIHPKPLQPGGPPMLVGGDSPHALRRVARHGDGSLVSRLAPTDVAARRRELAQLAREHGREGVAFQLVVSQWLAIDDDETAAQARAARALAGVRGGRTLGDGPEPSFVGAPGRLREALAAYADAGVDELMMQVVGHSIGEVVESLHRFHEQVRTAVLTPATTPPGEPR